MIEVECDQCGKTIKTYHCMIKNRKHHFCNRKCMGGWNSKNCIGENSNRWRGGAKEVNCDFCGKMFKKLKSQINRYKHHFCSHKCFNKYQIKQQKKVKCDYCDKIIKRIPHRIKKSKHHFCSYKCKNKWSINQIKVKCGFCGKTIKCMLYKIKKHKHHFCNNDCKDKFQKGENSPTWCDGLSREPYGLEFNNRLKEIIRKRDNFTCQECGVRSNGRKLDVHHIDYDKKNSNPSNLITLCISCNVKANFDRDDWTNYFQEKMMKNGVVK